MSQNEWERYPNETSRSYDLFCQFLDMGTSRNLRELAQLTQQKVSKLQGLSSRWNWKIRATAWDDEQHKRKQDAELAECEEMAKRHIRIAMGLQMKGLEGLKMFDDEEKLRKMRTSDIVNLFKLGVDIERMYRVAPNERPDEDKPVVIKFAVDEDELEDADFSSEE